MPLRFMSGLAASKSTTFNDRPSALQSAPSVL
jgi:hypothetical protein